MHPVAIRVIWVSNLCLCNLVESLTVVLQTSSPCIATDNVVRAVAGRLAQHMQSDTDVTVLLGGVKTDAEAAHRITSADAGLLPRFGKQV